MQDLFEVENSMNGEWLPKAAVEFDLRQDVLLYASASKAIRNGGLNSSFTVAQADEIDNEDISYDPDEMWAYEAGVKSQWLDNTLVINGSVFYNKWNDIQTLIGTSAGSLFENAGEAVSTGFELEGFWQINDWISFTSAFNYTKSEFKDRQVWETPESLVISQLLGNPPNIIEDGNQLPNVPEYSLSLAVDVVYPTALTDIDFTGHLDYQWVDERYQNSVNDPALLLPDYALSNLRLGLQSENWSVVGYVSNLSNEISPQSILRVGPGGSTRAAYLNRPRTWGLNLTYSF
ncbi:TonB-dependent receptor domain-containing protein [Kineobactrum salinum]|uniref:TonB-dependent receptor n=1 Tax=Kineobactrum salinum TaxID=2708301 RepID=A0A6C0U4A8_9GAMM|nr:TonB-dependent receptor [Kineobactrum salinum]QIB66990.1 TonB-dependent receptor [Kineobactrum salinum]